MQAYGPNAPSNNTDVFYRFAGKVSSISINDVQTGASLSAGTATVTVYAGYGATNRSGTVNVTTANTSRITGGNNPFIGMVRIQTP